MIPIFVTGPKFVWSKVKSKDITTLTKSKIS